MADRFSAGYLIGEADYETAKQRALNITVEQTVEIPRDIVPAGYVEDEILGRLEGLEATDGGHVAEISYSFDDVGGDFLQLLNVPFRQFLDPAEDAPRLDETLRWSGRDHARPVFRARRAL